MTPQAIGAGVAGTAVVGGGGALAAYAAGAFNAKWQEASFEDYAKYKNLKYLGETANEMTIPPVASKIKETLENTTNGKGYRAKFNSHWNNMREQDAKKEGNISRPIEDKEELFPVDKSGSKDQEVANWTAVWCKSVGKKKVPAKQTQEGKELWNPDLDKNPVWKAFKDICLEEKIVVT
ncbi:hypothetical protein [Candidatus Mycoplasma haematohominis]|uniref:Uncharacterized protein n=1 Tax=Candidatus Mycoplasma haematohominis TaxID=1494318 RepID=A0A478FQI1_9MOLU|nr:hypothetical protein [Candidatus Mycoplasma haemohominis]GCE63713.1 hypothetical protein MHSWG343_07130 [Candidatus Mycoplasma haemohominis]